MQQNAAVTKSDHCDFQKRPLGVTGDEAADTIPAVPLAPELLTAPRL
jgi:hypothetical protein